MRITLIDPKAPAEVIPVTFDFSALMSSIDSVVISLSIVSGTDVNVSSMKFSSAQISGTDVSQLIRNGVDTAIYKVRADAALGSEVYSLAAYLPVNELQ